MKGDSKIAQDVDEYLSWQPEPNRTMLERYRQLIKETVPGVQEVISYQMPGYKYHGMLVFFAGWANHCSLYALKPDILESYKAELKPFRKEKTTIQFSVEKPIPEDLFVKILRIRMKQNEDAAAAKKSK
jgi:uncharacterized protein YdhG (YjbR/CyaY superfamily)